MADDLASVRAKLSVALPPSDLMRIQILPLPADIKLIKEHGLLYLPFPYIVPGGRFNEMYGWDSYFHVLGVLRAGRVMLAKNMVDNQLYQVRHYGKVLNANRTYYLDRSQPPFLSRMVLEVFAHTQDLGWLTNTLPDLLNYHAYWVSGGRMTPTGLSRYDSDANTPCTEVLLGEVNADMQDHYSTVANWFAATLNDDATIGQKSYDVKTERLTEDYYQNDRAMRASGFDISDRFGPFSSNIRSYNPVCLNSLLHQMELDLATITALLGLMVESETWNRAAVARAALIGQLMWDEADGLFYDYNFIEKRRSSYQFITTFYPLWSGVATQAQADRVVSKLALFERAGGLQTSTQSTGKQWDGPFGWAPTNFIAVQGMMEYGHDVDARSVAARFNAMVTRELELTGTIREKYDVVQATSNVQSGVKFGYMINEVGFGWTNAVVMEFSDLLETRKG